MAEEPRELSLALHEMQRCSRMSLESVHELGCAGRGRRTAPRAVGGASSLCAGGGVSAGAFCMCERIHQK